MSTPAGPTRLLLISLATNNSCILDIKSTQWSGKIDIVLGPVLGFRSANENSWDLSALIISKGNGTPDRLKVADATPCPS